MLTTDTTRQIKSWIWPFLGADPELFVTTRRGRVVGSEKAIPAGLEQIALDGVQVELHPRPTQHIEALGADFRLIFRKLQEVLTTTAFEASFKQIVRPTKAELDSLSPASRQLGCAPSKNIYNPRAKVSVPKGFRLRSAGGHVHLGLKGVFAHLLPYVGEMIPLFDCLVGLPSVLLDPGPEQAIRRKIYGRAGEYRDDKPYGFEYRALSNYWLRSYALMGFVLGMSRLAVNVRAAELLGFPAAHQELLERVDIAKVALAINHNDAKLALEQWLAVESFIDEFVIEGALSSGEPLRNFRHFIDRKVDEWFPLDPMSHWCQDTQMNMVGWETFLAVAVGQSRLEVKGR